MIAEIVKATKKLLLNNYHMKHIDPVPFMKTLRKRIKEDCAKISDPLKDDDGVELAFILQKTINTLLKEYNSPVSHKKFKNYKPCAKALLYPPRRQEDGTVVFYDVLDNTPKHIAESDDLLKMAIEADVLARLEDYFMEDSTEVAMAAVSAVSEIIGMLEKEVKAQQTSVYSLNEEVSLIAAHKLFRTPIMYPDNMTDKDRIRMLVSELYAAYKMTQLQRSIFNAISPEKMSMDVDVELHRISGESWAYLKEVYDETNKMLSKLGREPIPKELLYQLDERDKDKFQPDLIKFLIFWEQELRDELQ